MRVLLLAPHPYYQDRGTPIAVDQLLRVLSGDGHRVDVLTYHEGRDVERPGVRIERIRPWPRVRGVPPGFSWEKLLCDLYLAPRALRRAAAGDYDRVHAVEESVFVALLLRWWRGIPYLYDMDSSLSTQLLDKHPFLRPLGPVLRRLEGAAIRNAEAVVAVCGNLARRAEEHGARRVEVLRDIALEDLDALDGGTGGIGPGSSAAAPGTRGDAAGTGPDARDRGPPGGTEARRSPDLRQEFDVRGPLLLYVGNLEFYQGIDLLLQSMVEVAAEHPSARLVIVGGSEENVERYRERCRQLGLEEHVCLAGPRPVEQLGDLLPQADLLMSPRLVGDNTPMKVYSYLRSGRPVIATEIPAHTDVLDDDCALLAPAEPSALAAAVTRALGEPEMARRVGEAGRARYERRYGPDRYREVVRSLYPAES